MSRRPLYRQRPRPRYVPAGWRRSGMGSEIIIVPSLFFMIGWIVFVIVDGFRRRQQTRVFTEFHGKLLDRIGSAQGVRRVLRQRRRAAVPELAVEQRKRRAADSRSCARCRPVSCCWRWASACSCSPTSGRSRSRPWTAWWSPPRRPRRSARGWWCPRRCPMCSRSAWDSSSGRGPDRDQDASRSV